MAKAHKDPADRKHYWEHPASEHDPYPEVAAAVASGDFPQHVHKRDGAWKEVSNADDLSAALADGWIHHSHLNDPAA